MIHRKYQNFTKDVTEETFNKNKYTITEDEKRKLIKYKQNNL